MATPGATRRERSAARSVVRRLRARRDLLGAFATAGGAAVLINLLGGIGGVLQSRALGPDQRGLLATAVAWPAVAGVALSFGAPHVATYFVARERRERAVYAGTALAIGVAVTSVIGMLGLILGAILGGRAAVGLVIMFAAFPVSVVVAMGAGVLLGVEDFRGWSWLRILGPVLTLAGILGVIIAGPDTAVAITLVYAGTYLVAAGYGLWLLRRRRLLARPRRALVRPILAYAWRNAANVGWLVAYKLDQLVLSVVVAPAQLGIYAVSATFGEALVPVAAASGNVLLARVSRGGHLEARASLRWALAAALAVAGAGALFLLVLAPQLVRLLFGDSFAGAATPMRILAPGVVALALSSVFSDTLRGLGRPLVAARAEAVGAVVTVVLLAALVPPLGIRGAAIASTLSYASVTVVMGMGVRREIERAAREERGG